MMTSKWDNYRISQQLHLSAIYHEVDIMISLIMYEQKEKDFHNSGGVFNGR